MSQRETRSEVSEPSTADPAEAEELEEAVSLFGPEVEAPINAAVQSPDIEESQETERS